MKSFLTIFLTAVVAVFGTWFVMRGRLPSLEAPAVTAPGHKLLYHQCSMHPWIKSDKPGRCTICGMELTPVYEGDKGLDASGNDDIVALNQSQIQVLNVQTSEAKIQPLGRTLRVAGTVTENAMRHRVMSAYVDGRIDKLHVNYVGAEVVAGQPLADYYSPTLLQAEREFRQLTGDLRKNTALRLRQMGLTEAQIEALDAKSAENFTSQILAPVSGTVVTQSVYEGQYVSAGEKLLEIADFSTVWFVFRVYEQDLPWIRSGQSVRVTTPSAPGKSFSGKISFIDPGFDSATRSTGVRVELANPLVDGKRELSNRLYADGLVEIDAPPVLAVPRSAVLQTGVEAVVYIDRGGGAYERRVLKTGRRGDIYQEVLGGLKEGDRVVTQGNLLIDGQAEMNRAFSPPAVAAAGEIPVTTSAPPVVLSDEQVVSIVEFTKAADAMAAALGADDLAAFKTASGPAMETAGTLVKLLRSGTADVKALDALDGARHFHEVEDLKAARVAFHKFSVAATAVLEPLRKHAGMPGFHVYECGMVNQAIPGVPKKAHWIQTGSRGVLNPFFGKEMPDCGEEIEP